MKPVEGRKRVIVEDIQPRVDCGRYPVRRFVGDRMDIRAAIFSDGHDHVSAQLLYKHHTDSVWHVRAMTALPNDLWTASFALDRLGSWTFAVRGWVDHFDTWCADLRKRLAAQAPPPAAVSGRDPATSTAASPDADDPPATAAGPVTTPQDIALALQIGMDLLQGAASRASGKDAATLREVATSLGWLASQRLAFYEYPLSPEVEEMAARYPDLRYATLSDEFTLWVDRTRARFSSWYELFPRSTSPDPARHGTLRDVEALLPEIAAMGFDILYLPPIHPIGRAFRKGPNNSVTASPEDEGSPWAIGSPEGGHKAIHPRLGTLADFDHLVRAAHASGMELAMDIAFQCSPDHPWVTEHPEWFIHRPDGTIQYAENPPKKYQDIYPLNFESSDWRALWDELHSVFEFWIARGVRVFRVDNPHTKALPFWEWCIHTIRKQTPEVIFLAEAFTRPHIMYSLAKAGFTQSYTYFTWRTQKAELQAYFEEISQPPISDFFTPNVWPNTPDILHASLQTGGRPAFMQRLILATTLAASYGIYGPAFELGENLPAKAGSEEYLDSEKYQIRRWNRAADHSLAPLVTRLNHIRKANPALHSDGSLHFHHVDNPQILCYSKSTLKAAASAPLQTGTLTGSVAAPSGEPNVILTVVNLDPHREQAGWIDLDLGKLGIANNEAFDVEDLLTGTHYQWRDRSNFVALRPNVLPAHVLRVSRLP
ncbi:MAG: alpha-1,4-glucan--maltose-1-phosphate maltosyltransferase [Acidobacteriota bacterium]|nr:alpha-1,4-glucan--maltose-1-phosphate maltosyltransferase [Acidobacteriota bacterium]